MTRTKQKKRENVKMETAAAATDELTNTSDGEPVSAQGEKVDPGAKSSAQAAKRPEKGNDAQPESTVAEPGEEQSAEVPLTESEEADAKIAALEREIEELNDRLLRKIAEFDNYRKRTIREQINLLESAAGPLMLKLLPILDDMEQLEKLEPEQATAEALLKGLTLIHQKISDTLRKEGLEPIPAAGEMFDPELHEVLAVMEDSEQKPGIILVEHQKGYRLKGRILRHSRVVINKDEE